MTTLSDHKQITLEGKPVFVRLVLHASIKRIPKLFAENEACFLFLTKGGFQFRTPTNILNFSKGDAMLAKCGNYYIESLSGDHETGEISATGAFFYPEMVKKFFEADLSLKEFRASYDAVKLDVQPLLAMTVESINFMFDNPEIADENYVRTKLKELLLVLARSQQADSISGFINSLFAPQEYRFKDIINQNLYSNLTLTELAFLCNCSLATFKRKFTEFYAESPSRYISRKRIEKAQALLQEGSSSIAEISEACGFESVTSFDRSFKKSIGISPSHYRLSRIDN